MDNNEALLRRVEVLEIALSQLAIETRHGLTLARELIKVSDANPDLRQAITAVLTLLNAARAKEQTSEFPGVDMRIDPSI